MIKLSAIKKNPSNPRVIKDEKFEKLCNSIKEFPEMLSLRPIVVDSENIVLGGNMRLTALKHLQYKEIPENWIARASDLTEEQKKRFILTDNASFGVWDWDILANEWDSALLDACGIDVPNFEAVTEPEAEEDDYQQPEQMQVDVVLGDLIEIGQHRLLCGDSTDSDAVARLMNGEKAEILFTSPPYNLGKNVSLSAYGKTDNAYNSYKDNKDSDSYFDLLKGFTNSFFQYCEYLIVNIQSLAGNKKTVISYQNEYINFIADIGVWAKSNPQPSMAKKVMNSAFEYFIFVATHENPSRAIKTANFHGTFSNVYQGTINSENKSSDIHKAAFPLSMCAEYIKAFCSESVIDCFCGTGTTMVAAHQLNRKCYGMELDPKYCQVIIDRMQKLDPSLSVKINGKEYKQEVPF